ncbi:MAG: FAD-binding protein [Spirochaetes bacterium]|nr:FAD-binding protein [Spirochaetota bacterium]
MYKKIDNGILDKLRKIAGENNVSVSQEDKEIYSHDEVAELRCEPEAVVRVHSAGEVSAILKLAQAENFPVTPRGAGQGLSGGAVPVYGGLVLSLEKMDRIIEIDEDNLMVTVQPGVITGNLHIAVEAVDLFYPPDPASLDSCSIGGNIAENAGGPRAMKYGVTKDYVCGLQAVLPSGEIINMGGKVVKNVTGYNLIQLLIGSEGTLAVITEILLRLLPLPKRRVDLLVPYNDFQSAVKTVAEIIKSRIVPAALEFMEKESVQAAEKLLEKELPFHEAAAHLLITIDGNDEDTIEAEYEKVGDICLENGAIDVLVADNPQMQDTLWEARRVLIEALQALSPERIMDTEDVVVPRKQLPVLLKRIREVADKHSLRIINFGHSGDGNVHVNIIKDVPEDVWKEKDPKAAEEIYRIAVDLGGMVSGEHGIGLTRKKFLSLGLDDTQIDIMKKIKKDFDPNCILNPGKIFA